MKRKSVDGLDVAFVLELVVSQRPRIALPYKILSAFLTGQGERVAGIPQGCVPSA